MSIIDIGLFDLLKSNQNFQANAKYAAFSSNTKIFYTPPNPVGKFNINTVKYEHKNGSVDRIAMDAIAFFGGCIIMSVLSLPKLWLTAAIPCTFAAEKAIEIGLGYAICSKTAATSENSSQTREMLKSQWKVTLIQLSRNDSECQAFFLTPNENEENVPSQWILHASEKNSDFHDKAMQVMMLASKIASFSKMGHCFINEGSVKNLPTIYQIGARYESALRLLEEINVKKIIMFASSMLGGVMLGKAIKMHHFKKDVEYISLLSDIPSTYDAVNVIEGIAGTVLTSLGQAFDITSSLEKPTDKNIKQIVIQNQKNPQFKTQLINSIPNKPELITKIHYEADISFPFSDVQGLQEALI